MNIQFVCRDDDGYYPPEAANLLAEVADWLPILRRLGLDGECLNRVAWCARNNGASFKAELLADGLVNEDQLYRALAAEMGVGFLAAVDPRQLLGSDNDLMAELGRADMRILARLGSEADPATLMLAPQNVDFAKLEKLTNGSEEFRSRVVLMAPSALRSALMHRVKDRLTHKATHGFFDWRPDLSARFVVTGWQGLLAGLSVVALPLLFWSYPVPSFVALQAAAITFFLSYSVLRVLAAAMVRTSAPSAIADDGDKPVYSVLVALYREAEIVPQLLVALGKLQWPRDRLEIKLVCESDDHETLQAIRTHQLRGFVEIVEVAPSQPRTKPKALCYALPVTRGEFVVIYDAEDLPHPDQLLEAWHHFRQGDAHLACLQAPLDIANGGHNLLTRLFAIEYAGLFRGMLPWLADLGQLFPLGGTSNHFRRAALEDSGGWDPHNVTEDADLAVRLARQGYRTGTLTRPTRETAPEDFATWRPQRVRWLKGWLQTWLVHMRHPSVLLEELGFPSFLLAQILLAGMVFSVLLHPVIFFTAIAYCGMTLMGIRLTQWQLVLFVLDVACLFFSYFAFLWLGWKSLGQDQRAGFWRIIPAVPVYWLMLSWAGWLAVRELVCNPHHWNKTPHKAARKRIRQTFASAPDRRR